MADEKKTFDEILEDDDYRITFFVPLSVDLRANPTILNSNFTIWDVKNKAKLEGFTFTPVAVPGGVQLAADKTDHGVTDTNVSLWATGATGDPKVFFSCEL